MRYVYRVTRKVLTNTGKGWYECCAHVCAGNKQGAVSASNKTLQGGKIIKIERLSKIQQ